MHHFKSIGEVKLELQSGNAQLGSKLVIFLFPVILKFDGWPWAIVTSNWSYSPQTPNLGQMTICFSRVTLKYDGWPWKTKKAPLLYYIKLCASFQIHQWNQTWVTVRKRLSGFMTTSVTLTFDFWPWPFACASSLSMVISPENFRMMRWQEHCQKGVTDGHRGMDRQTDGKKCS